ncbi:MAG: hypothetical protein WBQ95_06230 [Terracidiphilus sp.]
MICTEAAEFVSALCDGEIIPPPAAEHIGTCPACQSRLHDYLSLGVELRRTASLEQSPSIPARTWTRPQNPLTAFLQKGWGTMRIPRLAFAALIAGIVALACTLAVVKVGANSNGTVVLLNTAGPIGPLMDCPLSTQDKNQATCTFIGQMNGKIVGYKVDLVNRETNRVQLAMRTKVFGPVASGGYSLSGIESEPEKLVWFEPGEPLRVDVTDVGILTFTGEWMDHMPILIGLHGQDVSPGPGEVRFASPLILKDKKLVGDLIGSVGGVFSTDDLDLNAIVIYIPGEGRFLISQLQMKGAVKGQVALSRLSFEEGGHAWELVNGVPITRADSLWVLHEPDFKMKFASQSGDHIAFGNTKLRQIASGEWVPIDRGE